MHSSNATPKKQPTIINIPNTQSTVSDYTLQESPLIILPTRKGTTPWQRSSYRTTVIREMSEDNEVEIAPFPEEALESETPVEQDYEEHDCNVAADPDFEVVDGQVANHDPNVVNENHPTTAVDEVVVHNPGERASWTISNAARLEIESEKSIIKFRSAPLNIFPRRKGTLWSKVRHIDWAHFDRQRQSLGSSIKVYKGITNLLDYFKECGFSADSNYLRVSRRVVVCPLCYANPETTLQTASMAIGRNANLSPNTSNITQHFKRNHKNLKEIPDYDEEEETTASIGGVEGGSVSRSITLLRQSKLADHASASSEGVPLTRSAAVSQVKQAIYMCVNDLGFPNSTVEKPLFREMLMCVKRNASSLQHGDLRLSNKAIIGMRVDSYNRQVFLISELVRKSRQHLTKLCGKQVPFVTVCHDIWSGKKKDILGVCVMFIDPRDCHVYKIPIGMVRATGHSAQQVCSLTWSIMETFGFVVSDLCASVNDNTNAAILASKYITGHASGGKCDMHKADLILKHATGLCTRKVGGVVVDQNEKFIELYNKFLIFARWFMSKKARSRYSNFAEWCSKNNKKCIEIPLPNTTRVSGSVIVMQSLLRMKFIMGDYASQAIGGSAEFKRMFPKEDDWELLSEYEAVLFPLQKCSMALQSDDPGSSAASLIEIYHCRRRIQNMQLPLVGANQGGLLVLSVNPVDYTESEELWDGGVTIHKLEHRRKPVAYEALREETQYLIERLLTEYQNYFLQDHSKHSELSLLASPFLAYVAPKVLIHLGVFDMSDNERIKRLFVDDMVDKFRTIAGVEATNQEAKDSVSDEEVEVTMPPARKRVNDDFAGIEQILRLQEEVLAQHAGNLDPVGRLRNVCTLELDRYLNECQQLSSHIQDWIQKYPTEKYSKDSPKWSINERQDFGMYCRAGNYLQVAKYFDVLGWWRDNQLRYPHAFVVSMVWLGVPATNAFQERVFSRASWYDSNRLMNKQSSNSFAMRTLDSATRKICTDIVHRENVLRQLTEEQRFVRGERMGIEVHDVVNVDEYEPRLEAFVQSHTVQLVALTRQLAEYDEAEDPTLEGPSVPTRYLVNRNDLRFGDVDDIEQFEDDSQSTTTTSIDPEADNDIDLLSHLEGRVCSPTLETGTDNVSIAAARSIVSTGASEKSIVPAGARKLVGKSKKKPNTRKKGQPDHSKEAIVLPRSPVRYEPARIIRAKLGNTSEVSKTINRKNHPTVARATSILNSILKPPPVSTVARAIPPIDRVPDRPTTKLDREKQKKRQFQEMLHQSESEEDPDEVIGGDTDSSGEMSHRKKKAKPTSRKPTRTSPRKNNL